MSKEEEIAWKEYRAKYLSATDEPKENYPMYMLIFLAGYRAAQHSAHPTLLPARHKLVSCPQCKLMFGVDLPASQSG